ncbi:MAG: histone deacetylase, partial [Clostridiaceae bacterium]|nr:histone deacetylase [Clostridiaceae bacterium]
NVEAVALEHIRAKHGKLKVAIVDTDCHHGDGTEDIYWNDPDTLVISFHQDGRTLYPGTGDVHESGGPAAFGYNVNIPLPPQTGEEGFLYVLDNVVMPILDEYQPDLIINSAGQDNHYSDPITNMNFTAQGYAVLNDRLNPDIAVLEGGYSIEGALPYVNLGIILAMAGLDYSNVHEPDYNPAALRQSHRITDTVKRTCDQVINRWQNKEQLAQKAIGDKEFVKENKNVYYDTDGILSDQQKKFKVCPDCNGYSVIYSSSSQGHKICAINIPLEACSECVNTAYDLYEKSKKDKNYTNVYLQDRVKDEYFS